MAFADFTGLMGILLALSSGSFLGTSAFKVYERRRRSVTSLTSEEDAPWRWRFRNGFACLRPLAQMLLKNGRFKAAVSRTTTLLQSRGFVTTEVNLVSLGIAADLFVCVVCTLVTGSVLCGIAVTLGASGLCLGALKNEQDRQRVKLRETVPDALRSMSVCFNSGLSLLQTLQQVSRELPDPLSALFRNAAQNMETGSSASEALRVFRDDRHVPELSFVAVALDVQHQSGGSMGHVLDAARESVEGELELMRSLRIQTAQAKLSARIVTLMPFVLIALFSLISEDFLLPFFSSFEGLLLLGVALAMQIVGVSIVRAMLKIEVGS